MIHRLYVTREAAMRQKASALSFFLLTICLCEAKAGWDVPFEGSRSHPVLAGDRIVLGSSDGAVCAFQAADGARQWCFQTGQDIRPGSNVVVSDTAGFQDQIRAATQAALRPRRKVDAAAVVADGVVYIGSADHRFYALDAETGETRWQTDIGNEVLDEAQIADRRIVVSGRRAVYILDRGTGVLLWSTEERYGGSTRAAIVGDSLIYCVQDSPAPAAAAAAAAASFRLVSADIETGTEEWSIALAGKTPSVPVYRAGRVFVSALIGDDFIELPDGSVTSGPSSGFLYAVDTGAGALLWQFATARPELDSVWAADDGHVLILDDDGFSAIRSDDGALSWRIEGDYDSDVVMNRQTVYFTNSRFEKRRAVIAVAAPSGEISWRASLRGTMAILDLQGDVLYLSGPDRLMALSATDGEQKWVFRSKTGVSAPPVAVGGQLVFPTQRQDFFGAGSAAGHLYSVDATTGR